MMIILRILFCILTYFIIGKLFINIYCAIQEDNCDEDEQIIMTLLWPVFAISAFLYLLWTLLWTLISFISNKLSVIPIVLIKSIQITIKGKKEREE